MSSLAKQRLSSIARMDRVVLNDIYAQKTYKSTINIILFTSTLHLRIFYVGEPPMLFIAFVSEFIYSPYHLSQLE